MLDPTAVLCYVKNGRAWFTTKPLSEQWGDDWNDAPYQHNAGSPYEPCWHNEPHHRNDPDTKRGWRPGTREPYAAGEMCQCSLCLKDWNDDGTPKYRVFNVPFSGPWDEACNAFGGTDVSVEHINSGAFAWLHPERFSGSLGVPPIHAGTTYADFRRIVMKFGTLYEPVEE